MKNIFLTIFSFFFFSSFIAVQNSWNPPKNYVLKDSADYDLYASDIVAAASWMETAKFKPSDTKWMQAEKFAFQWGNGSPKVSIALTETLMKEACKKNKEFMFVFMCGYCANDIVTQYNASDLNNHLAGYRLIFKVYQNAAKKSKDKKLEKLIAMDNKNELSEYIEARLPKQ